VDTGKLAWFYQHAPAESLDLDVVFERVLVDDNNQNLLFTVGKDGVLWKGRFTSAGYQSSELVPLQTDHYPEAPVQPFVLEGEAGKAVLRHLAEYSTSFEHPLPELAPYAQRAKP